MLRRLEIVFVLTLIAASLIGCSSPASLVTRKAAGREASEWATEANAIGVQEGDIAKVVGIARERYRLVVIRIQKADGGRIAVYLADTPQRPHGIVVVFRKVEEQWQEDPGSKGDWII